VQGEAPLMWDLATDSVPTGSEGNTVKLTA
jgi:hypothetical protein